MTRRTSCCVDLAGVRGSVTISRIWLGTSVIGHVGRFRVKTEPQSWSSSRSQDVDALRDELFVRGVER